MLHRPGETRPALGCEEGGKLLHARGRKLGIEPPDPVEFLRPGDGARDEVPRPAADVRECLCRLELALSRGECGLGQAIRGDVTLDGEKAEQSPLFVQDGVG